MKYQHVWLLWSVAFLLPWAALYLAFPVHRRSMRWGSVFMAPFGLTEPLFVPEYWNPPSLFDLAQRTGFDIESIIFCFAIGGIGAALYNVITRQRLAPVPDHERRQGRHRFHYAALVLPFAAFPALYFGPWNPIYAGIVAMVAGAVANALCRPDLKRNMFVGGLLFLGLYIAFLTGLKWFAPGYIEQVWNLSALSGIAPLGFPIEELLFALGFGLYWTGVYEHFTWHRPATHAA